jgi:hypothetical protein
MTIFMVSNNSLNIKGFFGGSHKLYDKNRGFAASFHGRMSLSSSRCSPDVSLQVQRELLAGCGQATCCG